MFLKFFMPIRSKLADDRNPGGSGIVNPPQLGGLYFNMWRYASGARVKLGLTWLMLVGAALLELVSPWLGAKALNVLQKDGAQALVTAAYYGVAILAAAVIAWSLHGPARVSERRIALLVRK